MGCPRVHFSDILPESGPSAAWEYKCAFPAMPRLKPSSYPPVVSSQRSGRDKTLCIPIAMASGMQSGSIPHRRCLTPARAHRPTTGARDAPGLIGKAKVQQFKRAISEQIPMRVRSCEPTHQLPEAAQRSLPAEHRAPRAAT
mgnify:CR=1 FL=1